MIFTEIEVEDGLGDIFEVRFNRKTTASVDPDYGADADGNRGIRAVFVDEDTAEDLEVLFGEKWTPIQEVNDEVRTRIEEAVDFWLKDNEADLDGEPEYLGPDTTDEDER